MTLPINGTSPLPPSNEDISAFCEAAGNEDKVAVLNFLKKYGTAAIDLKDDYGLTALMNAVVSCDEDMATFLLSHGADVNKKNRHDFTALMQATITLPSMVELILEAGADTAAQDDAGRTALMIAYDKQGTPENAAVLERWIEKEMQQAAKAMAEKQAQALAAEIKSFSPALTRPMTAPRKLAPLGGPK